MMPRFGLMPSFLCLQHGCVAVFMVLLLQCSQGASVNQVSIEDFIDLDDVPATFAHQGTPLLNDPDTPSVYTITHHTGSNDVTIHINDDEKNDKAEHTVRKGKGHITAVVPPSAPGSLPSASSNSVRDLDRVKDVTVDDEDLIAASGSGSGSGDFLLDIIGDEQSEQGIVLTQTKSGRGRVGGGGGKRIELREEGKAPEQPKKQNVGAVNDFNLRHFNSYQIVKDILLNKRTGQDKNDMNVIISSDIQDNTTNIESSSPPPPPPPSSSSPPESSSPNNEAKIDNEDKHKLAWDDAMVYMNQHNFSDDDDTGYTDDDDDDDDDDNDGDSYDEYYDLENYYSNALKGRGGVLDESVYDISNIQSDDARKDKKWTKWRRVGSTFKVRVKQCSGKGQGEKKGEGCEKGLRVQVKSCMKETGCGEVHETLADLDGACDSVCQRRWNDSTPGPFSLSPNLPPTPAPTTTTTSSPPSPSPEGCEYSLYDTKRRKYSFVRWDLSKVLTQSKVKRWCKKDNDQYIIMSTPTDVCRKYLKDLCQASQKCKSNKAPRERGDFAEGCWRGLVFGDMLPIGFSNQQTIIYFICQRYSSDSTMGRVFGYKDTHFGTLYDTKLRAPVLSLHKMVQVGDETWPQSDYFIEHGLIEQKKDVMWLFSRHRKGMVTLNDLDRCDSHQTCDLGRFQALPRDYNKDSGNTHYVPTPLVWPEWMNPSPETRTATLTLTNTVPLHSSLQEEWATAVRKVRTFAIQECGVPYVSDPNFSQLGQLSSHRSNKSALYLASGATPSRYPAIKTGRDIPVPSYLWVAGCCVQKLVTAEDSHGNDVIIEEDEQTSKTETKISSFTFYIENETGSLGVTSASVFRLEELLKDFYKVRVEDPDVTLFPGQNNACSDLRNDVSSWF